MVFVKLTFILLFYFVLTGYATNINKNEENTLLTSAVLNYLNSNPNKVYDYKNGIFISAQQKADIIELTIDVHAVCVVNYPEVPCAEQLLTCSGFLKKHEDEIDYKVLSDVLCKPKGDLSAETVDEFTTTSIPFEQDSKIELSHEAVSSEHNIDFVAVRADAVPCSGCPIDLNVDAKGVSTLVDYALKHVESERNQKHVLIKVIKLQEQVVAGIIYTLTLEIAPTICQKGESNSKNCPLDTKESNFVCEVKFLEIPWISKEKYINANNCTVSQVYDTNEKKHGEKNDLDNEINAHYNNPMDPKRLANLESQIVNFDIESNKPSLKVNKKNEIQPVPDSSSVQEVGTDSASDISIERAQSKNLLGCSGLPVTSQDTDYAKAESKVPFRDVSEIEENLETRDSNEEREKHDILPRFKRELTNSKDGEDSNSSSTSLESKSDESKSSSEEFDKFRAEHRIKRSKNKDDSSSSSSSSSENKSKEKNENKRNADSSSSSSSSSESKDNNKKKENNNDPNDSSSSSSSSSSNTKSGNIQDNRIKRSIGQLEKISQDEKSLVRDLADFAASSLDNIDDDNHKRVILQILGAKKLKLDGIYFQIILRLGVSHCLENEENENCREKLFTNLTKICKVQVHVEDDFSSPKVVKSQCQNIKKDEHDRNRTNYSRYRRNVLPGGLVDMSLDDPRITTFAKEALTKLDSESDHPNRYKIVSVLSATSQVVSGYMYRIKAQLSLSKCLKNDSTLLEDCDFLEENSVKTCDINIWERLWLKNRQYSIKCDDTDQQYSFVVSPVRNKRSLPLPSGELGGINEVEIEDHSSDSLKAWDYLKRILIQLDSDSGHSNKLKVEKIVSVQKQVVAGELWRIKALITLSECPKSLPSDPQNCKNLEGSESRNCFYKIWDRPWLKNGIEVETTCENDPKAYNFRLKRNVGSKYIIPSSLDSRNQPNPKILEYIKAGLQYLDSKSVHGTKYVLKKIIDVAQRTGAGSIWYVTVQIALSDCSKYYYMEYCEELENSDSENKICHFNIWQGWLLNGFKINITCDDDVSKFYSFIHTADQNNSHVVVPLANFKDFMIKYNKTYLNKTEFDFRLKVFKDNLETIKLLNKYEQGTAIYGITQFADLTSHEFSKSHGLRMDLRNENDISFMHAKIPNIELPTEFDWRKKAAVTEVKNQGSCGSCWAFSTIGNVEGQYAIKYGKLLEFSEQELVDCDKLDEGCNGGLMDNAYRSIEKLGGLESESDYPYDAEDEKCHFSKTKVKVQLSGALNISQNEDDMAKWLVNNGPISIAINANAMQFYFGGVSHPWKMLCSPKSLDHGVLIVGYGVHTYPLFNKTLPYWIIKNSWGPSWGEQGYYRVYRGDGTCGLNQTPSSAIVA